MLPKNAYIHALNSIPGCGPALISDLLRVCKNDAAAAWQSFPLYIRKLRATELRAEMIVVWKSLKVEKLWSDLHTKGIQVVSSEHDLYPGLLKNIHLPPPLLYYRGCLAMPQQLITVVGTRHMSAYGALVVKRILTPLLRAGIGIISGLAYGVDAAAQSLALEYGAYTAGVIASGADDITPHGNRWLGERILAAGGAIISENPCGTVPQKGSFARRNRLLSGLSKLTIVIEASTKSGALITARRALEQNREVGAVPGPIQSVVSRGCHALLREGAHVITDADDVFGLLCLPSPSSVVSAAPTLSPNEQKIITTLSAMPMSVDDLQLAVTMPTDQLLFLLTSLEIQGQVIKIPGRGYGLAH